MAVDDYDVGAVYMYYIDEMMIMVMVKTFVTRSSPVQGEVAQHCVFI